MGTISGWGLQHDGTVPGKLQVANVTILAAEECRQEMEERNFTWWDHPVF